jgi:hypothetical protein
MQKSITAVKSIHPWFITGLTDGDGYFYFSVTKSNSIKVGYTRI